MLLLVMTIDVRMSQLEVCVWLEKIWAVLIGPQIKVAPAALRSMWGTSTGPKRDKGSTSNTLLRRILHSYTNKPVYVKSVAEMLSWFQAPPRVSGDGWFSVGLASSFPDIGADEVDGDLSQPRPCSTNQKPGCKVFHVPVTNSAERSEVPLIDGEVSDEQDLKDQVLVFRYRGKFHAIDHVCEVLSQVHNYTTSQLINNNLALSSLVVPFVQRHTV